MNKIFFFISIFIYSLFGQEIKHQYILAKDQVAKLKVIKKIYKDSKDIESFFYFRWTLYNNDQLVLLTNYNNFSNQYILKKRYKRDSIRVNLLDYYNQIGRKALLILKFKDYKNSKALFQVYIRDPKNMVNVKFFDPKKEG